VHSPWPGINTAAPGVPAQKWAGRAPYYVVVLGTDADDTQEMTGGDS
jgi:hypothetical protein